MAPGSEKEVLGDGQAEKGRQALWNPEEGESDPLSLICSSVASQPLVPCQVVVRTVRTFGPRDRRRGGSSAGKSWFYQDLQVLAMQTDTCTPLVPSVPVPPEQWSGTHGEGMKQYADLARFRRGATVPLALLAQGARTARANASSIDHTQALISFSAIVMRQEHAPSRTTQRPTWLEGKVNSREVVRFPGRGGGGWRIS